MFEYHCFSYGSLIAHQYHMFLVEDKIDTVGSQVAIP